jgi:aspartokinase/homoserine dehydrogenase 1
VRPEHADVVLLGFGQIGRTLAGMLARARQDGPRARVVGVIDRSGYVFDPDGISSRRLASLANQKARGRKLRSADGGAAATTSEALAAISRHALSRPIFVDLTADDTSALLRNALGAGMDLVLANKRPLSGKLADARALEEAARAHDRRILHETTVGAGLPIIDTYYKLVEARDRVHRIDGCTSGTLGFLLSEIGRGGRAPILARRWRRVYGARPRDAREWTSRVRHSFSAAARVRGSWRTLRSSRSFPRGAKLALTQFLQNLEVFDDEWDARAVRRASQGACCVCCVLRDAPEGWIASRRVDESVRRAERDRQPVAHDDALPDEPTHRHGRARPGRDRRRCVERHPRAGRLVTIFEARRAFAPARSGIWGQDSTC